MIGFIIRFYPSKIKKEVQEIVESNLKDKSYDQSTAQDMSINLATEIRSKLKKANLPCYKFAVQTVIGELAGQGLRVTSKCLWDDLNDDYTSYTYKSGNLFCVVMVFAYYYE